MTFAACEKTDYTEELTPDLQEIEFRAQSDYEGIWKIQLPNAKYYKVDSVGDMCRVINPNYLNCIETGLTMIEDSPGNVTITGLYPNPVQAELLYPNLLKLDLGGRIKYMIKVQ